MDKKLNHLISRSNLTARERFLLLIKNDIEAYRTGKEPLTAAYKEALQNWKPSKNDTESRREWNTLVEGARQAGIMGIEGEMLFNDAQIAHLRACPVLIEFMRYPAYCDLSVESLSPFEERNHRLVFRDMETEKRFQESIEWFVEAYGKLLALREATIKLSARCEIDFGFHYAKFFSSLDGHIRWHNEALDAARKCFGHEDVPLAHSSLKIDPSLYIDRDAIKPDEVLKTKHLQKLKEIFENF